MLMKKIGIFFTGFGMIGRVHALAYRELSHYYPKSLPDVALAGVCTSSVNSAMRAAKEAGIQFWTNQIDKLVNHQDVDVIDCCTPNYMHYTVAIAAIQAGKPVLMESPLALNSEQAEKIAHAARKEGVRVGMIFNYRFLPAILHARQLIEEGFLGQVYQFQIEYLHTGYQNSSRPMGRKLRKAQSGGGALVDLGSHIIDMVRYLMGDFSQVLATTKTFITQRPIPIRVYIDGAG